MTWVLSLPGFYTTQKNRCFKMSVNQLFYRVRMETVDLTVGDYPTNNTKNVYDWLDLCLTTYDKNILLDSNEWVCDTIVDAAQTLLKKQFPQIQSLQSVTLGLVMKFRIPTGEFLQVIHCNNHGSLYLPLESIKLQL